MWHFTFADGGFPIRPGKGVVRKPCWNRHCVAVFLSNRRAASCHCATAGVRGCVVDFEIRFELHGDTIVRRLDLQSALRRMNGGDFMFQVQYHDGAGRLSHMGDCREYLLLPSWAAFPASRPQTDYLCQLRVYLERLIGK